MHLYKLNKTVLRVSNNPAALLNGITCNTIDASQNAFLDKFGKIVAVFEQKKINDNEILLVVEKQFLQKLYAHLKPYLALSPTKIRSTSYFVYFDTDHTYECEKEKGDYSIPQKKGQLIMTTKVLQATVTDKEFTIFRLKNNIPLQGIDYDTEMALNVSEDFISFTKGCFLGQEIIARVKNLGKPPKKIEVCDEKNLDAETKKLITSRCMDSETGKVIGFVLVENK